MFEDASMLHEIAGPVSIKLAVALICGILLGTEREINEKPAGLRTLILITVGATLYMIVSDLIAVVTRGPANITRVDPSRVAAQVVTGIGFLGGGAIIQARASIRGLTTAADIWVAAGIGLVIGVGFPLMGVGITLLVLLVLVALDPIRARLGRIGERHEIDLVISNDMLVLERVTNVLQANDIPADQIHVRRSNDHLRLAASYYARKGGKRHFLDELASIDGVRGAEPAV